MPVPRNEPIEQLALVRRLMDERENDDDQMPGGDDEVVHHAEGSGAERLRLEHRAVGGDEADRPCARVEESEGRSCDPSTLESEYRERTGK